jgi:hypothetical protein
VGLSGAAMKSEKFPLFSGRPAKGEPPTNTYCSRM